MTELQDKIKNFIEENNAPLMDLPDEFKDEKANQTLVYNWKGEVEDEIK